MSDDWLDQLDQLRQADKAKQQLEKEELDLSILEKKHRQAIDLLRQSHAHKLLRQMQKSLLGGGGALDIFDQDQAGDYDRVITLAWQGPISAARRPDPNDPEPYCYILIGVRDGQLWVNGRKVAEATSEALKTALLQAARKPGRETRK